MRVFPGCAQTLLLKVMQHSQLLESNDDAILLQKIQLRAPYVTPLNVLQVYCLKALRAIESGQGIDPRYKARPLFCTQAFCPMKLLETFLTD